jgi:hypothetical protein
VGTQARDQVLHIHGGHYLKVKVLGISNTSAAAYCFLESSITDTYYGAYDITTHPVISLVALNAKNDLVVQWNLQDSAEEYDLEWTFVDDYDTGYGVYKADGILKYNFDDNATRVTLTMNSYKITNIFEHGYVLFRVRGVSRDMVNYKQRLNGKWSSDAYTASPYIVGYSPTAKYHVTSPHQPTFIWQYSATYAEEGKKKEVISYLDGSYRVRQTVTKVNTDSLAIVGETIYDYQGRGAVQVLPVPDTLGILTYHTNFNKNQAGVLYSRTDFDLDGGSCSNNVSPMDSFSGAGNYYSTYNPLPHGAAGAHNYFHNYIPSAVGYPFSLTEFTPDNTGRIRRQSGVGYDLRMNSGHETKYFYGVPSQEEMDRLFGNSVGFARHYKKNMVEDANGQVSVSYMNAAGKVVATALAGDSTPGMTRLPENTGGSVITENLLNGIVGVSRPEDALTVSRTFLVSADNTSYTIDYRMNDSAFKPSCLPSDICYECVYDLTISLRDDCGNELLHGNKHSSNPTPLVRTVGKIHADFDTICPDSPVKYKFSTDSLLNLGSDTNFVVSLNIGSYTIIKKLTINNQALDYYTNQYIRQDTCLKSLESFIDEKMDHTDFTSCHFDCATCKTNLGTKSGYRTKWMSKLTASGITILLHADTVKADARYDSLLAHCNTLCQPKDPCLASYGMLKADVSPGGQYLMFDTVHVTGGNTIFKSHIDGYPNLLDTTRLINYKTIITDSTYVKGVKRSIASLSVNEFVKNWQEKWADLLLSNHPEYCYYNWCEMNSASNYFDDSMLNCFNFDTAYARGYFSPLDHDPYFKNGGKGRSQRTSMSNILSNFTTNAGSVSGNANAYAGSGHNLSMQEIVIGTIFCKHETNFDSLKACADAQSWATVSCAPNKDAAWAMWRGMYLSQKRQLMDKHRHDSLSCNNSSITNRVLRFPTDANFLSSPSSNVDENASHGVHNKNQSVLNFTAQGDSTCKSYADYWMGKLAGCHLSPTDSTNIRNALIAVCDSGVSPISPFGSSSSQPGRYGSYSTFQEVLVGYGVFVPGICDANLITMPQPYGHDYFAKQSPFANTCSCDITATPNDSMCSGQYYYDLVTHKYKKFGVANPITGNSDCGCKNPRSDSVNLMVNLIKPNVPDSMKCNHCINCDSIHIAMQSFISYYAGTSIDTFSNFKTIFTNYLNGYFSFNLTYDEYTAYMGECVGTSADSAYQAFKVLYDTTIPLAPPTGGMMMETTSFLSEDATFEETGSRSFLTGSPWEPEPGYSLMDTCSCNKIFKMYKDSVNATPGSPYWGLTMEQIANVAYGVPSFPEIHKRMKDCQHFLNKDSSGTNGNDSMPGKHWDSWTQWKFSSFYTLHKTVWEKGIQVPMQLLCITGGLPDSTSHYSCDSFHWDCQGLNNFIDSFELRHPSWNAMYFADNNSDSIIAFEDSLNVKFNRGGCHHIPLGGFFEIAIDCQLRSGPHCFPTTKATCNFRPTSLMHQIGWFLEELAADTTFVNDSLLLQYYTTFDIPIYSGSCRSTLYKTIKYLDDASITMGFSDGCGFVSKLQLSNPDPALNMDEIFAFHNIRYVPDPKGGDAHLFKIDASFHRIGNTDTTVTMVGWSPDMVFASYVNCDKLCNKPLVAQTTLPDSSCEDFLTNLAIQNATVAYNDYLDSIKRAFRMAYTAKCMKAYKQEKFTISHIENEYHFTLYYYDQGGNLVQTVPPQGVGFITRQSALDSIDSARIHTSLPTIYPNHKLVTVYQFNTLNQLVWQHTPDADSARFWYDKVGRKVISRNRQQAEDGNFSYTKYDALGRIIEVGQIQTSSGISYNLVRDDTRLTSWLSSGTKSQITRNYYDEIKYSVLYKDFVQENLRNKIASTTYQESDGSNYDYGTHYSYDIHENICAVVQQNTMLAAMGQNYKLINYSYDLVSGKENEVIYQKGENDAFYHKYYYDADNRLTLVMTSQDNVIWDEDAAYFYYYHGPLGRVELGDNKVQGIDYAYTIEGWIKGVNSNMLREKRDIGRDGDVTLPSNINANFARDAFGYSLSYFNGDYKAINLGAPKFEAGYSGSSMNSAGSDMFNGNIKNMVTAIKPLITASKPWPMARVFQYDQLNRLVNVKAFINLDTSLLTWKNTGNNYPYYAEKFTYDQNGNVLKANRRGDTLHSSNATMDSMEYKYYLGTNKLKQISDDIDTGWYKMDIDNESDSNNYIYDKIGNLITDKVNHIDNIKWYANGKLKSIQKSPGNSGYNLTFAYDPLGNRTMKLLRHGSKVVYYYYIYDIDGNIMAVYCRNTSKISTTIYDSINLIEHDIYGTSRIGLIKPLKLIQRFNYYGTLDTITGKPSVTSTLLDTNLNYNDSLFSRIVGEKRYELKNHLGNVMATISDRKLQHSTNLTNKDYYLPDIITAYDYYVYGAPMPGRTWSIDSVKQVVDSCITCSMLKHIMEGYGGSDLNDSTAVKNFLNSHINGFNENANQWLTILENCNLVRTTSNETSIESIHNGNFGPTDQSPTSPITPSDDSYSPYFNYYFDSTSCSGGNAICKTVWIKISDQYIYGFDNQRKDNEINGEGDDYTAEFWEYDPRIGRRWNIDPVVKVNESPFVCFGDNPILAIDPNGADSTTYIYSSKKSDGKAAYSQSQMQEIADQAQNLDRLNGITFTKFKVVTKEQLENDKSIHLNPLTDLIYEVSDEKQSPNTYEVVCGNTYDMPGMQTFRGQKFSGGTVFLGRDLDAGGTVTDGGYTLEHERLAHGFSDIIIWLYSDQTKFSSMGQFAPSACTNLRYERGNGIEQGTKLPSTWWGVQHPKLNHKNYKTLRSQEKAQWQTVHNVQTLFMLDHYLDAKTRDQFTNWGQNNYYATGTYGQILYYWKLIFKF